MRAELYCYSHGSRCNNSANSRENCHWSSSKTRYAKMEDDCFQCARDRLRVGNYVLGIEKNEMGCIAAA